MFKTGRCIIIGLLIAFLLFTATGCGIEVSRNGSPNNTGVEQQQGLKETESSSDELFLTTATVSRVVDGDTVHVALTDGREEKVRLIGVDTPESTGEVEPYGKEAAAHTREKLDGKKIWLELDTGERDRYDRMLAYIWLEKPANDSEPEVRAKMYNAKLLLNGYARVMTVPPNVKYANLFVTLQQEARAAGRGLWSRNGAGKKAQDENGYYVGNSRSKKFHRPDCQSVQQISPANLVEFKTVDEALNANFEPCRVCKP